MFLKFRKFYGKALVSVSLFLIKLQASFMTGFLSCRNQSINWQSKSMDWFLHDRDLCHKRLNFNFDFNSFMTRPLSCRNQSIDLLCKSVDSFLYDNGLRHERVNRYGELTGNPAVNCPRSAPLIISVDKYSCECDVHLKVVAYGNKISNWSKTQKQSSGGVL